MVENPHLKRMMKRDNPILGNPHIFMFWKWPFSWANCSGLADWRQCKWWFVICLCRVIPKLARWWDVPRNVDDSLLCKEKGDFFFEMLSLVIGLFLVANIHSFSLFTSWNEYRFNMVRSICRKWRRCFTHVVCTSSLLSTPVWDHDIAMFILIHTIPMHLGTFLSGL